MHKRSRTENPKHKKSVSTLTTANAENITRYKTALKMEKEKKKINPKSSRQRHPAHMDTHTGVVVCFRLKEKV